MKHAAKFFKYAEKRHQIYLDRKAGKPFPWTKDPILNKYKFTNVYRELDKTTAWFKKFVREPMRSKQEVLLATVLFRMLNRIEVGEAIFCQPDFGNRTAFDILLETGNMKTVGDVICRYCGAGPYVTGAYIITSPKGYDKLSGILKIVGDFMTYYDWRHFADLMKHGDIDLEQSCELIGQIPFFGTFHSYEIVTDLRHTDLLCNADDINTWANIGPGCRRGLNRIAGRDTHTHKKTTGALLEELRYLLELSRSQEYWPNNKDFPAWEMREVEHTCCEFDKYERVRNEEGKPRSVFRIPA